MGTLDAHLHEALIGLNPLFAKHWPDGKRDFRGMTWPNAWRGGLFYSTQNYSHWKALFGDESDLRSCEKTLIHLGYHPVVKPPHTIQIEGEEFRTLVNWWTLSFETPTNP